jgi:anti-sigma factor RsiW
MSKEEDDIRLLEYIDGQLGAEDAAQLHRRLENEPS